MSSDLYSGITSIQLKDFTCVVVVTAVVYDFILIFPSEIDYVWKRPWSWVSTMFIFVRLSFRSRLLRAEANHRRTVFYLLMSWTIVVFLGVMDVLMILRIYAMYNRSRRILVILLVIYILVVVNLAVTTTLYTTTATYVSVTTGSLANYKFCVMTHEAAFLATILPFIPQFILSVLLCSLVVGKFVRESLRMHQAVKRLGLNQFLELFARESILFLSSEANPTLLSLITYIFPYVLAPRFVITVRELHSNMVGGHVDTGFGAVSQRTSMNHTIVFASAGEVLTRGTEMPAGGSTSRAEGAHGWSDDQHAGTTREAADDVCD
ncbi:hypothetical protein BU15DRAFT_65501 [Melanogaster broomeanus]|nr:hypothetical protein BU15DRAFT_65501 [Melanogaster broomeanus]